jgi:hypothetical protein
VISYGTYRLLLGLGIAIMVFGMVFGGLANQPIVIAVCGLLGLALIVGTVALGHDR